MYKRLFVLLLTAIYAVCLSGCISDENMRIEDNDYETTEAQSIIAEQTPKKTEKNEETAKPTTFDSEQNADEEMYTSINADIARAYILNNEFSIENIINSLELSREDIIEIYKGTEIYSSGGRDEEFYFEMYSDKYGIYLINLENSGIKYIEIDPDKVSFLGINQQSDFKDVIGLLGETDTIIYEYDLLGLKRYELVYEYNDSFLRVYSFDENGESGLYFCFTDEYQSRYGFFEIMLDQIDHFFTLTKDEIQIEFGEGESPYSYRLEYEKILFYFNEEGTELQEVSLYGNFQINGLRDYMSIEKTESIMGKGKKIEHITSEDGILTTLQYEYNDFVFKVNYLLGIDRYPWWDFVRKE